MKGSRDRDHFKLSFHFHLQRNSFNLNLSRNKFEWLEYRIYSF